MTERAVSLLSGGMDSATVLAIALKKGYDVTAITFDYGQRHSKEIASSEAICNFYGIKQKKIKIDLRQIGGSSLTSDKPVPERPYKEIGKEIPATYVPSRNIIFASVAAAYAETIGSNIIFIGANSVDYSGYPDCRPEFFKEFQKSLTLGTKIGIERGFEIEVPLQSMSKGEIVKLAESLKVPLKLTWSCYNGGEKACGTCDSCRLRLKGFMEAGSVDPIRYERFPPEFRDYLAKKNNK
jgi:7-cyano-7-deazaguanine synthase